ncbi:MAG: LPS assembly lipoprotein LptE [Pseudomonadota bacterium]
MSSYSRRTLLVSLAALGGCGFEPVYAPGGSAESLRGALSFDAPKTTDQFDFVARLEERLGRASAAPYALSYSLKFSGARTAITPDLVAQRETLNGQADFTVKNALGETLTTGAVRSFSSFSARGTTVATRASEQDARKRLMVILADQVVSRLIATAPTWLP